LNRKHHLLDYANDVNLLGHNIDTIKKDTETLEVNAEKTKYVYMLLSGHQKAGKIMT
jgi:hypothetical protein